MKTIEDIIKKYKSKIDYLDLEIIISRAINKSREFVLAHPEKRLTPNQKLRIGNYAMRRIKHEPLAYILGNKEFYGLDFKVNKNTLIPRPETELLVDETLKVLSNLPARRTGGFSNKFSNTSVVDIGTGSGNIIISLAKNSKQKSGCYATDISEKALRVAKQNAKLHKVYEKIKFFKSSLLGNKKLLNNLTMKQCNNLVIVANLPYLSEKIYMLSPASVKKYEPQSALLSSNRGLFHYEKLLKQLKKLHTTYYPPATPERSDGGRSIPHTTCILEISPEQKTRLNKLIKQHFPKPKVIFKKDLAKKWRVCIITL
ncbi:release factor glutamine methyltransferase [bacterium BMS3Abin15]|nr:release factor glutamine methyltransferase [bacterium BMS3Abin15]HDZ85798.1 peptide chain release factor N(5)-glutamine methyltransferase [Candidatus Moranbacteria bacterium]